MNKPQYLRDFVLLALSRNEEVVVGKPGRFKLLLRIALR